MSDFRFNRIVNNIHESESGNLKESTTEKLPEIQETINAIESHLDKQPQSVQDLFIGIKEKFYNITEIDGKKFMFTQLNGHSVLALVEDMQNPGIWKTRIFRFSGSDHQWKSLPGERGDGSYMKGEEGNPFHHYVQSAKLHKDIYKLISNLPQKRNHYPTMQYLPNPGINGEDPVYWEEFEFKEKYQTLKNKEWASYQDFCQRFFKAYDRFVVSSRGFKNFTLEGGLYQWVTRAESIQEFKNIKNYLEEINNSQKYSELLINSNLTYFHLSNENPDLKKIAQVYDENISSYIEKCFKGRFPETMLPNFSDSSCIDRYQKNDLGNDTENNIYIEEYKVDNIEGDELVFAMAYDGKGRVYIDNIYDPRVGISDYGIPEEIVQMGHLVYKPEDYPQQASFGFPKKYIGDIESYVDINALWQNIPVINNFKKELIKRGIINEPA
ncbi:MAG TPA: hypothetical protein PKZ56_00540 [Candidatus Paceibacterota bacterium]|nr:hypothetical protein [Candidatus Paceibacterota bacterium]